MTTKEYKAGGNYFTVITKTDKSIGITVLNYKTGEIKTFIKQV